GFPALYTRILTLKQLGTVSYYGYLLLYNAAYMLDDLIILSIGVITLSQHRLQEKEGRWLKLISGLTMVGLGIYLLVA
ncbi:MAG: NrdH-redoxin, partial [Methylococcaceae bacterium]|nr:NrdH-redoxin [Methylococcaceae bacterium]